MANKTNANDASQEQFPSDVGRSDVEIAQRTVDTDKATATKFTKVFVLGLPADTDFDPVHEANKAVVLQEAINLGLHPDGQASFEGSEPNEVDGNTNLTYTVKVTPAHVDDEPASTVTPSSTLDNNYPFFISNILPELRCQLL